MKRIIQIPMMERLVLFDKKVSDNLKLIDHLLLQKKKYTWKNLVAPIEASHDELNKLWSSIDHLNAVDGSPESNQVYDSCLAIRLHYFAAFYSNLKLYRAIHSIIKNEVYFVSISVVEQAAIKNLLLQFRCQGVELDSERKIRFMQLVKEIGLLENKFERNLINGAAFWKKHITNATDLSGLSSKGKKIARKKAMKCGLDGWLLTFDAVTYEDIMQYADSGSLREAVYKSIYGTAISQDFDNTKVVQLLLRYRHELANLLGFKNYLEYSLQTKMVKEPKQIFDFLYELIEKITPQAQTEYQELTKFAASELGISKLMPWDKPYVNAKFFLKMNKFVLLIGQRSLPESIVLEWLFKLMNKLFRLEINVSRDIDIPHPDTKYLSVLDSNHQSVGYLFLDLYARKNKKDGGWMKSAQCRRCLENGEMQLPVGYIVCNFQGAIDPENALLNYDDVVVLFHEFGHALQHILTTIEVASVSGMAGIPIDAIELPSQFFENLVTEKSSLDLLYSIYYRENKKISKKEFDTIHHAKKFHSASTLLLQLSRSLFDLRLHYEFNPDDPHIVSTIFHKVMNNVFVGTVDTVDTFANNFVHIFADVYAAGFYSYLLTEAMAADIFEFVSNMEALDIVQCQNFKKLFLEPGGTQDVMTAFETFIGRKPDSNALLRKYGVAVLNSAPRKRARSMNPYAFMNEMRKPSRSSGYQEKRIGDNYVNRTFAPF